jgi:hypothetical protein
VAVLALVFYAYLGAVVGPEENLEDLHIALINKDRGGDLAGRRSSSATRCSVTFSRGANVKKSGKVLRRQSRTLAHRLSFAARKSLRVAVSFCKGHT